MESSSCGGITCKSTLFIDEHMSVHGVGLDAKAFTTVRRGLCKIKPEDEDELFVLTDADFSFFIKSGIGTLYV